MQFNQKSTFKNQPSLKVCGMRAIENIKAIEALGVAYMGFIFYKKSKRYVHLNPNFKIPKLNCKTVGVFVNEPLDEIIKIAKEYQLDYLQLHGDETVEYCEMLKNKGFQLIKAFSIGQNESKFDFEELKKYEAYCAYFLFDTKTPLKGGSGKKFDWTILEKYNLETPFFLSGGISLDNINVLKTFTHSKLSVLDINSKFEIEPALKNVKQVEKLLIEITHAL